MWKNHITKALPCINTQQTAAKTTSEDQQPLIITYVKYSKNKRSDFTAFIGETPV
jgi:hypothetical protein